MGGLSRASGVLGPDRANEFGAMFAAKTAWTIPVGKGCVMVSKVPVIAEVDLLVAGGSFRAVQAARVAQAAGRSVLVVTGHSYFGEDRCASLDLWRAGEGLYAELVPDWSWRAPSPLELKRKLESLLVGLGIPFYFQMQPMGLLEDAAGKKAGVLVGDRSGVQAIRAKMVLDATERSVLARQTAMPFAPFVPGPRTVERVQLLPDGVQGRGELMPHTFKVRGMQFNAWTACEQVHLAGTTPSDLNRLEAQMRRLSWDPAAAYTADQCRFMVGDAATGLDPEGYVVVPGAESVGQDFLDALAARPMAGMPCRLVGAGGASPRTQPTLFTPSARFADCPVCEIDDAPLPDWTSYDVTVVGGGTGGAAAGIGAARQNAKTLVLENLLHLGGVGTEGRIATYWFGNRCGFTAEVDRAVAALGGCGDAHVRQGNWNVEWKQQYWQEEAIASGAEVWYGHTVVAVRMESGRVSAVLAAGPCGAGWIRTRTVVDATGCSDIAAAAGAPTVISDPQEPAYQGVGLSPRIPGAYYENSDYTFCDDTDVLDRTRAYLTGRECYEREFDIGCIVNSRERRRIVGDLTVEPMGICLHRRYRDTINIAISNFDTHGFTVHPFFLLRPPHHDPLQARVPYRALLPQGVTNVLVTGLGMSAHRDAMPVIRMQPDVQNQGYAAGIAAAMAAAGACDMRAVALRQLQQKLVDEGILPAEELAFGDEPLPVFGAAADELAAAFADPASALPALRARFQKQPTCEDAQLLAFLGDDAGRQTLVEYLQTKIWDEGWAYTGMGQFGMCLSRVDCAIMALARIARPEDAAPVLRLLEQLTPDAAFSHYRACAMFFAAVPMAAAAGIFERLLGLPGMRGHAVRDFKKIVGGKLPKPTDTLERNRQLKEYYLAYGLLRCDGRSARAREVLQSYAQGMQGLYALHAKRELAR